MVVLQPERIGFDGEVVARAVDLTMEQVLPVLPPVDIGGSIDAMDTAQVR